jgi:hypothetical protein
VQRARIVLLADEGVGDSWLEHLLQLEEVMYAEQWGDRLIFPAVRPAVPTRPTLKRDTLVVAGSATLPLFEPATLSCEARRAASWRAVGSCPLGLRYGLLTSPMPRSSRSAMTSPSEPLPSLDSH